MPMSGGSDPNSAATRKAATASIAGGMIAATGRPHSIQEALDLLSQVEMAMYPQPGNSRYDVWKNTADLSQTHK